MFIKIKKIKSLLRKKFQKFNVNDKDINIILESLIASDLRGHNSHGVMRSLDYLIKIRENKINLKPKIKIKIRKNSGKINGDWGFGQIIMLSAIETLKKLMRKNSIACVVVKNCNHIGRLAFYTDQLARKKILAICFANLHGTSHIVSPVNGLDRRLPSNPISISAPSKNKLFSCDFATSSMAEGKIKLKYIDNQNISPGHLIDFFGKKTCDPKKFYNDPKGSILPFGGLNNHKGFALSLAIDIIGGILSGAGTSNNINNTRHGNSVTLIGINISNFVNYNYFINEVKKLENHIKSSRKIKNKKIYFPGDLEQMNLKRNKKNGISISKNLLELISKF
jgi:uncharacterized oxidoreductase